MLVFFSIAIVIISVYFAVQERFKVDGTFLHTVCAAGAFSACGLLGLFYDWQNALFPLNLGWILAAISVIYGVWKARGHGTKTYAHQENSRVHRRHF